MAENLWAHWVPLLSVAVSFTGLMLVFVQLRRGSLQREAQSLVQIFDINRQLLTLGFSNADLFKVLHDEKAGADPIREEHYLQLWMNQMWLIHLFLAQSTFSEDMKEPLLCAMEELATLGNFRRLWQRKRGFYPASFRKLVDGFINEKELPASQAAPEDSGN